MLSEPETNRRGNVNASQSDVETIRVESIECYYKATADTRLYIHAFDYEYIQSPRSDVKPASYPWNQAFGKYTHPRTNSLLQLFAYPIPKA
jgi:hypothetical protein